MFPCNEADLEGLYDFIVSEVIVHYIPALVLDTVTCILVQDALYLN
jgi:hypothetical protein